MTSGHRLDPPMPMSSEDRKSTRLNSSHSQISYAVFCLKKKKKKIHNNHQPTKTRPHDTQTHTSEGNGGEKLDAEDRSTRKRLRDSADTSATCAERHDAA